MTTQSDGKMFRATLWEEDGKAFQYTVRIEPMDPDDDPERPVLHRQSGISRAVPDALGADRPVAQEPQPEEVAPDRPAQRDGRVPEEQAALSKEDELSEIESRIAWRGDSNIHSVRITGPELQGLINTIRSQVELIAKYEQRAVAMAKIARAALSEE